MLRRLMFLAVVFISVLVWTDALHAENEVAVTLTSRVDQGKKVWSPESIKVLKGQKVKITLHNETEGMHGFSIDALKIRQEVPGGKQTEFTFMAEQTGEFKYYCHLHPAHVGGTLVVE